MMVFHFRVLFIDSSKVQDTLGQLGRIQHEFRPHVRTAYVTPDAASVQILQCIPSSGS